MNRNTSNFDNQEITLYYNTTFPKIKSSNFIVLSSVLFLMILSMVLATQKNKSLYDYKFYANTRLPVINKFHINKLSLSTPEPSLFFNIGTPLIRFNPAEFFEKFKDFKFPIAVPDTVKPDTTKKTAADSILKNDSAKSVPNITDTTKIDTAVMDPAMLLKIMEEDSLKKIETARRDSIAVVQDSLHRALLDSIMNIDSASLADTNALKNERRLAIYDSTARITHFTSKMPSAPHAPLMRENYHPLFGNKHASITYEVKLDSTTNMVIISEKLNGVNIRIPTYMSLDSYIALSRNHYTSLSWEEIAHKYELIQKQERELGSLLTNITNIDIPIPENPLMSIFGDRSRINLRITGAVDIKGAFRSQKTEGATLSRLGNTRSEPDFKQTVNIQVDGTVGDKLTIGANWDTQRVFEFENQLRIAYKGYEDEIIQSVEAGNVGVSSTSSLVGSSQALFGIKASWLLGPLKLTTVASQKKSEKKEVSVSGGSQKSAFDIKAYSYQTNHFFIDSVYRGTWEDYFQNATPKVNADLQILDIEVWVTRPGTIERPDERSVVADIDLPELPKNGKYDESYQTMNPDPGRIEVGKFIKLTSDQYILHNSTGYITLNTSVSQEQAIAVAYRLTNSKKTYGYFSNVIDSTQSVLVLKLVKPKNLIPAFTKAWAQQIKCIYWTGGRGITAATLENVKIWYSMPGGQDVDNITGISFLEILGLDKTDKAQSGPPDGTLDYFEEGRPIDGARGEIIFPTLEPFRNGFLNFTKNGQGLDSAQSYVFADVYDTTTIYAQQNTIKNRFSIKGEYAGTSSSTYRLGMSVVPGSVKVLYNGEELIPGVDFVLDEIGGQVILKKEEALVPGANVQIKYEENDLISFASKTLLGATGEMDFGTSTKLGFSWINLVQQTLSDKVRLGEEPINNHIFGIAGSSAFDLPFITDALNYIPFFSSKDPSNISLHAEAAYILPDPNTKKSTIEGDNNEGVAYIDDFEGARQYISLGTSWGIWRNPSVPVNLPQLVTSDDSIITGYKAKSTWYNIMPSDVNVTEIWPNRRTARGDEQQTYLTYKYDPSLRSPYNYYPTLNDKKKNWGGIMRCLGSNATQLKAYNYTAIEIWMKVNGEDLKDAKLYLDLGKISEKVIVSKLVPSRGGMHTEDGIVDDLINSVLDDAGKEDVGMDRLNNSQEKSVFPNLGEDPSADNFYFQQGSNPLTTDYSQINGQEGNGSGLSDLGRVPDTEDLNKNSVVDLTNSYFEYEIPLDTLEAKRLKQIVGGGNNGWYQFRIPLNEYAKVIGKPDLDQVESVRLWVTGTTQRIELRIAQFDVVGNQWQELKKKDTSGALVTDSSFKVTVVSIEETPTYHIPPGVKRAVDRTRPDENIEANEQALALEFKGLPEGESREAVKYLTNNPLDVFNYKTMRMFVYGDPSFQYIDTTQYDAEFFFRFGVDTANYYEYRMPLKPGWSDNNVVIDFKELTAVKSVQDSLPGGRPGFGSISVTGTPGAKYQIQGNPTLTKVTFLSVGVYNSRNKGTKMPLFGQVWVNELRLTKVSDTPGWAIRGDASIKISNLANFSLNFSQTNPDFHSVDTRFGSRTDDKSWGLNGNIALSNILPKEVFGQNLSVSFSHTESVNDPVYIPGTDISIKEAADKLAGSGDTKGADSLRVVSQTIRVNESISVPSIQLRIPVKYWLIEETINKLNFSFNYNNSSERNPQVERRKSWGWSFSSSYSVGLSSLLAFSPFTKLFDAVPLLDQYKNIRYSFLPELSFSLSASRSGGEEKQRAERNFRPPSRSFAANRNMTAKFKFVDGGLLNPGVDYSASASSNYTHLETEKKPIPNDTTGAMQDVQRSTKAIFSDIFFKNGIFYFGIDNNFTQDITISNSLALPKVLNFEEFLTFTLGDYKAGYKWQNNIQQGEFGKTAAVTSGISPSMTFKLKALADKIFGAAPADESTGRGRSDDKGPGQDSTGRSGSGINFGSILRSLIKVPLLDFESISISFNQNNNNSASGLPGTTGFTNMWGRIPFYQGPNDSNGTSREYQLGLLSDPTGRLKLVSRPGFPFFGFDVEPGRRVADRNKSVQFTDNFSQNNNVSLSTSRTLFENISLSFNWKVAWGINKNKTFFSDSLGITSPISSTSTSNIDRSFIALPDFFLFNLFGAGGIKKVAEIYGKQEVKKDPEGNPIPTNQNEQLADAFERGFEFFPVLSKIFGSIAPRANWSIRWGGLEKIPFIGSFASTLALSHAYTSNQTKRFRSDPVSGGIITDGQRIQYNFSPLLGVDITFKELLGGSFNSNFRISSGAAYDLTSGTTNITETTNQEISASAGFAKQGLQIPLFGLYLKNDIDISITISYSGSARKMYKIEGSNLSTDGASDDNSGRTSFEPRFKYVLSSKVTGSVYYRYSKTTGARIPGTTTNEGGLDVHISIN